MRVRQHLALREAAHLVAHLGERLVEAGVAEGGDAGLVGDQLGELALGAVGAAFRDQVGNRVLEAAQLGSGDAQRGDAHRLALAHGDAARHLRQVLAERGAEQQALHLAQAALALEPLRPAQHLPQRFDVGGKPRQPMGRGLHCIQPAGRIHLHARCNPGVVEQALGRGHRLCLAIEGLGAGARCGACCLANLRHVPPFFAYAKAISLHCTIAPFQQRAQCGKRAFATTRCVGCSLGRELARLSFS